MPRRPQPDADTVELLSDLLARAQRGELHEVFVVFRHPSGDYDSCFNTTDLEALLFEAGGEVMRARIAQRAIDRAIRSS